MSLEISPMQGDDDDNTAEALYRDKKLQVTGLGAVNQLQPVEMTFFVQGMEDLDGRSTGIVLRNSRAKQDYL